MCALATTSPTTMHRLARSSRPSLLCSSAPVDSRAEYSWSVLRDSGESIPICPFTCPFDRLWLFDTVGTFEIAFVINSLNDKNS